MTVAETTGGVQYLDPEGLDISIPAQLPREVEDAITSCRQVHSVRAIAARLVRVLDDPRSTVQQLEQVVRSQTGLTSQVLRLVNSSFYGRRRYCASIERAVMTLGYTTVRGLVLAVATLGGFPRKHPLPDLLWKHGLAMATICRELTLDQHRTICETAFLCGLVHNLGKLVLLHAFPTRYSRVLVMSLRGEVPLSSLEISSLRTTHADVGARLAVDWAFDARLSVPHRLHHRLDVRTRQRTTRDVQLITHAIRLAEDMLEGQLDRKRGLRPERIPVRSAARRFFGFSDTELEAVWSRCHERYEEILGLFP